MIKYVLMILSVTSPAKALDKIDIDTVEAYLNQKVKQSNSNPRPSADLQRLNDLNAQTTQLQQTSKEQIDQLQAFLTMIDDDLKENDQPDRDPYSSPEWLAKARSEVNALCCRLKNDKVNADRIRARLTKGLPALSRAQREDNLDNLGKQRGNKNK